MTKAAVFQLRLPHSTKSGLERAAKRDGTSMNQLVATAVAEKLARLDEIAFFEERAKRADMEAFRRFMNREGGEPPREGDELPEGWVRTQ